MTGAELSLHHHRPHFFRQSKQPHRIRDVAAAFAKSATELFLRMTEFVDQPAIAFAFFNRVADAFGIPPQNYLQTGKMTP